MDKIIRVRSNAEMSVYVQEHQAENYRYCVLKADGHTKKIFSQDFETLCLTFGCDSDILYM